MATDRNRCPIVKAVIDEHRAWRRAEVRGARSARELEAYLPRNYKIEDAREEDGRPVFTIAGEDQAGWTMDDYVIPRLASGLIFATEVVE